MSESATASKPNVALLFAVGPRLIECHMACAKDIPFVGKELELLERDLHTRSTETCTRVCCRTEPTALYRVTAVKETGASWDGLNAAIEDRAWEEGECKRHEWCNLFDSYTLASYLRLEPPFEGMPERVIVVEMYVI